MPANVTVRANGVAEAMYTLVPAWHGIGIVVNEAPTSEQALKLANLDWDVLQFPVNVNFGDRQNQIPGTLANVRSDNHHVLGVVSTSYRVVQNRDAFRFLDALVEDGSMVYEAAFSLSGGKQVAILGRLPESDWITEEDEVKRYVFFDTSHDGNGSVSFGPTAVRTVCANTIRLAKSLGGIKPIYLRHAGDFDSKVKDARNILLGIQREFTEFAELGREMTRVALTHEMWQEFLDGVCPELKPIDPHYTIERAEKINTARFTIEAYYENHPHQQLDGVRGTLWAAFNAVTQYVDYMPRRGADDTARYEARFRVTQQGTGHTAKQRALAVASRMVAIHG